MNVFLHFPIQPQLSSQKARPQTRSWLALTACLKNSISLATAALALAMAQPGRASDSTTGSGAASCATPTVMYRSCGESKTWCGIPTYTNTSPRVKYLKEVITESADSYTNSFSSSCNAAIATMACPGSLTYYALWTWNTNSDGNCIGAFCGVDYVGATSNLF